MVKITLAAWCQRNKVPVRTAQTWAKTKQIQAEKKRAKVVIQQTRTLHTYFIDEKTPVPHDRKSK
jgi:predicted site-specific integrase-resolvase